MANLEARIGALSSEQLKKLGKALASAEPSRLPRIRPRAAHVQQAPLSFAQERLCFLERLGLAKGAYDLAAVSHLDGALDVVALERSFVELLRRHEVLRTCFGEEGGQAVQLIGGVPEEFALPVEDLSGVEAVERAQRLRVRIHEVAWQRFDLARGPLLRAGLMKVGEQSYVLALSMHHIVSDGWSIGVLQRELSALYTAYSQSRVAALEPLPVQYADYALWQREWLRGELIEQQLGYWKKQLEGAPPALELPTDRPRPAVASYRGAAVHFELGSELSGALVELSRRGGVTLFMVLMAAYQLLLSRWSGQSDVVVGTPIAGRQQRELEGLIGFFVNTLAMRCDLSGDPPFRQLLQRVRETALGAYAHQDLPFEKLVEALQPARDLSRQAIFQVWFVLEGIGQPLLSLPHVQVRQAVLERSATQFDLSLSMRETQAGLVGLFEYSTDLFDEATIQRLSQSFGELLRGIVAQPEQPISVLPLQSAEARAQLLSGCNQTTRVLSGRTLMQWFEQTVRSSPQGIAVRFGEQQLSYAQLDEQANQLAHYLIELGVGPDVLVGICLERSVQLVVGLLGILKAGGAYLPLDPQYPAERLAYMLSDALAPVLLTNSALVERLPAHWGHVVQLDSEQQRLAGCARSAPEVAVHAEHLAYAIYTSGSLGRPKAVLVPHRALSNHMQWMAEQFPLNGADVVLQKTSLSFDASVWEVFAPLLSGATLALAQPGGHQDAAYLCRACVDYGVTNLQLVPSMLQLMVEEPQLSQCASLRRVFSGGEQLSGALSRRLQTLLKGCTVHNLYGPTETCIQAIVHTASESDRAAALSVPIGRPIWNTRAYVLDERLQPVPAGVGGELYISGAGLARGYQGRSALSAERFVADPLGAPGSRMYRTGDRVRWLAEGVLEFLGRVDQQVKLRGYRIELGEIEAVLRGCPGVEQVVVLAREDSPGKTRLVAYVVGGISAPHPETLRQSARQSLPDYMMPAAFVTLERLPLNPNGKLDRAALPAPEAGARPEQEQEQAAPHNEIEAIVAVVFADVLDLPRAGADDNFFELGGHSLLATRLVSRLREVLQVELPLRTVFEAPSVRQLSTHIIAMQQRASGADLLPPVGARPRPARVPLSFSQERLWFLEQLHQLDEAYHAAGALHLDGALDVVALERSFVELLRRHEVLRTCFGEEGGQAVQLIGSVPEEFALPVEDLSGVEAVERAQRLRVRIHEVAWQRFDLGRGPLLRAVLMKVGEQSHVLALSLHHIVSDGWSIGVLQRELSALYTAYSQSRVAALEPLPVQYADYALWQREWLRGELIEQQLGYWKKQLEGAPPALELPTDRPRPAVASFRGAVAYFEVGSELSGALVELSRRGGVTLFMVLMAAYQVLLSRWSGQSDVVVGTPIAGRRQRELEGLIGFFVNTLAMRCDLSGDPPFRQLLQRVRETALGAYAHQDLPFEKLVEALQPARDLSRQAIFQVWFVLEGMGQPLLSLPHVQVRQAVLERSATQFDLSLSMRETQAGLMGMFEYSTDLFDEATIQRLSQSFVELLRGIVAQPEQPISVLPLQSAEARAQLLSGCNQTTRVLSGRTLMQWFEQTVRSSPQGIAVRFGEQRLSYAQLDEQANQLAHYLIELGVGPDVLVGICLERSVQLVVGLLGILKAGGAYLPLDPQYPAERLAYMLSDALAPVLLTDSTLVERLPAHWGHVVQLDSEQQRLAGCARSAPEVAVHAEHLAYAIYTSGSLGRPKAVLVPHRALSNHMQWMAEQFPLNGADVVLQKTSLSFDASVWEVFAPLLSGATLALAQPGGHQDAAYLCRACVDYGVTNLQLVPSMLQLMVEEPQLSQCASLRRVFSGGEQLSGALSRRLQTLLKGCTVHNLYGPTETCIQAIVHTVSESDRAAALSVPIGRPIWNTRAYVLDERLQPVPAGVGGELYISGAGLARGYQGRSALSAERFVADPLGAPGSRMYRTGDRVRWLAEGVLEFLGRVDQQVKLRGYRIELGEIEAVLRGCPGVEQVVVLAREDSPGKTRLVAYVVGGISAPHPETLRQSARQSLPDYMMPAAFVTLERLPLNPNGKLDRAALPAPEFTSSAAVYVPPATAIEMSLAAIWTEVLDVTPISVTDDFFELGGHSLAAMQVLARMREEFAVDLQLRDLFASTTLQALAQLVAEAQSAAARASADTSAMVEGTI